MSATCFVRCHGALLTRATANFAVNTCIWQRLNYGISFRRQPLRRVSFFPTDPEDAETSPKLAPVKMSSDSTSLGTRIGAVILVAGLVIGSFLPLAGVVQNATTDQGSAILNSQLRKVPVFTVTDATGRPYMSESDDRRLRRGFFFVQPADAQQFLEQISEDNSDAKVLSISLEEAYKFLDTKSTPAKSIPERFELFPDSHELEIAQKVTDGAFEQVFGKNGVPIFYIDGLAIKEERSGQNVYPLFFAKEKLDETIDKLKVRDPNASIDVKDVQVIDLKQTIKELKSGANPRLRNVRFVPLEDALTKLRSSSTE
eukprot:GFKZ01003646.1.p1 GENE.GFKZ01003646.1~~GFKZ01003646.1.p1  ORF type:complete len:314 (-),score=39.33 GFKZ01003646.1:634-1575(-)